MNNKTIKKIKAKYKFLKGVKIEIVHSHGNTAYKPLQQSIVIYTEHIRFFYKYHSFLKRFGKCSFNDAVTLTLLHEIGHVKQHHEYGFDVIHREQRTILDSEDHDNNWTEKEADSFARREAKNWGLTKFNK